MYLREFDLDLPYIADGSKIESIMKVRNLEYIEATRYNYSMSWKQKRHMFGLETRCISAMYERLLEKFQTKDCWKILVDCVERITDTRIINYDGVYTVQIQFPIEEFFQLENIKKKQLAAYALKQGIDIIIQHEGWAKEPFDKVYREITDKHYQNKWIWKRPKISPQKTLTAEVHCEHDIMNMDISLVVRNNNGEEITRQKILSEIPDEFAYAEHLGKLQWLSNNQVCLVNKNGDMQWTVTI